MLRLINADYHIKIGIKDGKVVSLDWREVIENEDFANNEELASQIKDYLQQSVEYFTKTKRKESNV